MGSYALVNTRRATVSGDGMISFDAGDAVRPMKSLVFEGKCTQDGTPTPDNPIPIKQNDSKWKSVGFNLFSEHDVVEISTGGIYAKNLGETGSNRIINMFKAIKNTGINAIYYTIDGGPYGVGQAPTGRLTFYNSNVVSMGIIEPNRISYLSNIDLDSASQVVLYGSKIDTTYIMHNAIINISQPDISISPHNGDYEPYHLNGTVDLSPIKLNSIPGTDIKDEFDAQNGKLTRRVGVVDMGGLAWRYTSNYFSVLKSNIENCGINELQHFICQNYPKFQDSEVIYEGHIFDGRKIGRAWTSYLAVKDSTYTDLETFKTAMSGSLLYYELATPTEEYLTPQPITQAKSVNTIQQTEGSIPNTHVSGEYSKDKNYILCENGKSYRLEQQHD